MSIPHLKNGQAANTLLKFSIPDMSDCCMFLALITSFGVYSTIVWKSWPVVIYYFLTWASNSKMGSIIFIMNLTDNDHCFFFS